MTKLVMDKIKNFVGKRIKCWLPDLPSMYSKSISLGLLEVWIVWQ